MNTIAQLRRFITESGNSFERLMEFVEHSGRTATAPTISKQSTPQMARPASQISTENSELSDSVVHVSEMMRRGREVKIAPLEIYFGFDINIPPPPPEQPLGLQPINDYFNSFQIDYLRYCTFQRGLLKRNNEPGLHSITDNFGPC